jgi:hypothetical protein
MKHREGASAELVGGTDAEQPTDIITIDKSMTASQLSFASYANARAAQVQRILAAVLQDMQTNVTNNKLISPPASESSKQSSDDEDDSMDLDTSDGEDNNNLKKPNEPLPPRFDEISRYLIKNWSELALHSLHFEIPEHVLFAYILRNGGLELRADEWRSFLKCCNQKGLMFKSVSLHHLWSRLVLIHISAGER